MLLLTEPPFLWHGAEEIWFNGSLSGMTPTLQDKDLLLQPVNWVYTGSSHFPLAQLTRTSDWNSEDPGSGSLVPRLAQLSVLQATES